MPNILGRNWSDEPLPKWWKFWSPDESGAIGGAIAVVVVGTLATAVIFGLTVN